jgi:hypothetical protein
MSMAPGKNQRRWLTIIPVVTLLLLVGAAAWVLRAQGPQVVTDGAYAPQIARPNGAAPPPVTIGEAVQPAEKTYPNGVRVVQEVKHDTSPPVRDIPAGPPMPRQDEGPENPSPFLMKGDPIEDPVVQHYFGVLAMPTPILTFEGISVTTSACQCAPPDTNGDVGPNHYVQTVNAAYQVFDKNGASIQAARNINTIFTGFGGPCEMRNDGDPIVLYDSMADRWFINQFTAAPPYYQCTAVSTTPNPTGSYYRYAFFMSATDIYDYQKYGVWPDGYYMTANVFANAQTYLKPAAIAFDRTAMLAGQAATFQEFNPGNFYGNILPSDMDGTTPPPAGSPNYFATISGSNNRFRLWKFHVDWANPAMSSFTGPTNLITAPYDPNLCGGGPCVPQQGTTNRLDTLGDHPMFRLAYRNFGTHESLVTNHTVDVGGDQSGIRWYEVRSPDASPFIYQQGTYAPDTTHRWMGSAAQDRDGNLAIGYSASRLTMFPAIRYAGRLATDPLGVLAQGEATLFQGTGSQTGTSRWGDYSAMVVDPTDDCTFYYTTEYFAPSGPFNWRTRVGKFSFPSCGQPVATATGTPPTATATAQATSTALPTVTACSNYTYTTGTGGIEPGTVDIGNHCDDCATYITLPFPIKLYDQTFNNATIASNGNIQFVTTDFAYGNACLPVPIFEYGIIAYWDDLTTSCPNCGIYTSVSGDAPDRIFNVEWRSQVLGVNTAARFEIRLYEGQDKFDLVYGNVIDAGRSATIGVQRDMGAFTQYSCNTVSVTPNLMLTFTLPACAIETATPVATSTIQATQTPVDPTSTTVPTLTPPEATATVTLTAIATGTPTPVLPTSTLTSIPATDTPVATQTPVEPTATIIPSTATSTVTPVLPTLTVAVPTLTVAVPTATRSVTPVATQTTVAPTTTIVPATMTRTATTVLPTVTLTAAPPTITSTSTVIAPTLTTLPTQTQVASTSTVVPATNTRTVTPVLPTNTIVIQPTQTQVASTSTVQATFTTQPTIAATGTPLAATATPVVPSATLPAVATTTPTTCAVSFTDVPANSTFYVFIRCLACRGIMGGYSDGTFRPNNDITRGQLTKIVANSAGFNEPVSGQTFEDVSASDTFYQYIERMASRGIVGGYPCGGVSEPCGSGKPYFRPNANATRGQISKIVSEAAGYNDVPEGQTYEDVATTNTFYVWIERLTTRGIMSGYPCGGRGEPCGTGNRPYFRPNNKATRGQTSKIVANTFYPDCQTP